MASEDEKECVSATTGNSRPAGYVFFARCPPVISVEELHSLFSQYGEVKHINLFRRWSTAKTSKGCGTVEFSDRAAAEAALKGLNGKHKWPEADTPMVVEWADHEKQKKSATAAADDKATPGKCTPAVVTPTAAEAKVAVAGFKATSPVSSRFKGRQSSTCVADAAAYIYHKKRQPSKQQRSAIPAMRQAAGNSPPCTAAGAAAAAECKDIWDQSGDMSGGKSAASSCSWLPGRCLGNHSCCMPAPVHLLPMMANQVTSKDTYTDPQAVLANMHNYSSAADQQQQHASAQLGSLQSVRASAALAAMSTAAAATANTAAAATNREVSFGMTRQAGSSSSSCQPCFSQYGNCSGSTSRNARSAHTAAAARGPASSQQQRLLGEGLWNSGSSSAVFASGDPGRAAAESAAAATAACYSLFNCGPGSRPWAGSPVFSSSGNNLLEAAANTTSDSAFFYSDSTLPILRSDLGLLHLIPSDDWLRLHVEQQRQPQQQQPPLLRQQQSMTRSRYSDCDLLASALISGMSLARGTSLPDNSSLAARLQEQQGVAMANAGNAHSRAAAVQLHPAAAQPGSAAAAAGNTAAAAAAASNETVLELAPANLATVASNMESISRLSGARLEINVDASSGLQLALSGRREAVNRACELLCVLLRSN